MSTLLDSHRAIAYVTPVGVQLDIETVEVNLDETQSPYGESRIVCQLPDEATQKLLDLRTTPLRLQLRLRQDFASAWSIADFQEPVLVSDGYEEVRRNYCTNPAAGGTGGWSNGGANGVTTREAVPDAFVGSHVWRVTRTSTAGGNSYARLNVGALNGWVAVSVRVRNRTGKSNIRVILGNSDFTSPIAGNASPTPSAGWTTVTVVQHFSSASNRHVLISDDGTSTWVVGSAFEFDGVVVGRGSTEAEARANVADYFDGSTSPDSALVPSWVGTPNASQSILSAEVLEPVPLTSVAAWTRWLDGAPLSKVYQTFSTPWNSSGRRPSTSRWFDLMVSERSIDHKAAQLTLVAYTDEALMLSDALVATSPHNPGTTSVRSIAEQLLDRVGAVLTPGPDDGTVEADSTLWRPGMTAWDYFAPLAQAANLRLWCDERRRWHLTEVRPTAEGAITVNPTATLTAVTDTMTVTGEEWYDAVVIRYRWVDAFDLNQERYDAAGAASPRNVLLIEHDTPYPGAGAAAGILSRAQGRGRVLDVEAVSDYTAQPGMPATITPPATDAQTGFVSSVTWRLPDAEMSISTRGLVDTPPTSWLFVPAGVAWDDIPAGVSWNTYTPELIGA